MDDEHDDLDLLFARAAPPAPATDFGPQARVRLRAIRGARRLTLLALVDLIALALLPLLAFLIGAEVAASDAWSLLRLAFEDRALAIGARDEIVRALVLAVPWRFVLLASLNALFLLALTSYLLRATDAVDAMRMRTAR